MTNPAAPAFTFGALYRVTACPRWEYLTVGEVYRCDGTGATIGLHRPTDGCGTYIKAYHVRPGCIELEQVQA